MQRFVWCSVDAEGNLKHALSWRRPSADVTKATPKATSIKTRLWIPAFPTPDDMNFLTNPEPAPYSEIAEPYLY